MLILLSHATIINMHDMLMQGRGSRFFFLDRLALLSSKALFHFEVADLAVEGAVASA
jgi:hypothetical protein